jgi:hypothetical protein
MTSVRCIGNGLKIDLLAVAYLLFDVIVFTGAVVLIFESTGPSSSTLMSLDFVSSVEFGWLIACHS